MQIDQLRHDEQLLLIGLYHRIMHADGVVTLEEKRALLDLRRRMRVEDWGELLGEAREVFPDVETLSRACRALERPAARQLIYEELVRLAAVDEVAPAEGDLLNWLAVTWGFASFHDERAYDRIGDEDATVEIRVLRPEEIFSIAHEASKVEARDLHDEESFGSEDLTVEIKNLRDDFFADEEPCGDEDLTVEMRIVRE